MIPSSTRLSHGALSLCLWVTQRILTHRYPPTDEVFFVQNAGAKAAGTGLQKSAITQKIALSQVANVTASGERSVAGKVDVVTVDANPAIVNPNGEW